MSNEKTKACLGVIHEGEATQVYRAFRGLIVEEIDSLRESNDSASPDEVLKNQGAIGRLKHLLKVTAPKREAGESEFSS